SIPFLGVVLGPVAFALGVLAGNRLDSLAKGEDVTFSLEFLTVAKDVIEISKKFFALLVDIFNTIFHGAVTGHLEEA
ncbi:MAG: hypothetical protein HQL58_09540, partial [Magnetococcales bacterium]|nr:hypothetical protein [Magnetococcales bacterium]